MPSPVDPRPKQPFTDRVTGLSVRLSHNLETVYPPPLKTHPFPGVLSASYRFSSLLLRVVRHQISEWWQRDAVPAKRRKEELDHNIIRS